MIVSLLTDYVSHYQAIGPLVLGPVFGMTLPAYFLWVLIRQAYGIYEHTGYQVDTSLDRVSGRGHDALRY